MKTFLAVFLGILAAPAAAQQPPPPPVPNEPGLYYWHEDKITRVEGRAVSFARTGSLLSSAATMGIKSRKTNAQIPGSHADMAVSSTAVFYYRIPSAGEAAGGSVGDLVLVKLRVHGSRRQFEMGAAGMGRMSSGISIRSQLDFKRTEVSSGLYRAVPADPLPPGQYAFYLFRGYDLPGFVYDFMVE